MDIELSGTNVLISICLLSFSILVLIKAVRAIYALRKEEGSLDEDISSLMNRNKYLNISPLKKSRFNFKIGLACSLAFVLLSFSWTTYIDNEVVVWDIDYDEILPIDPPATIQKPPPPPPPPPPVIEEVPEEEILEEEQEDFIDQDVEDDTVIEEPIIVEEEDKPIALPPPPPEIIVDVEDHFVIVEQMPRFPGCENISGGHEEKKACADKKMLDYIYSKLTYPRIAMENGVEGTVVLQFIVDKEGKVSDIKVVRGVGAGCDLAATKVISDMNLLPESWTPGKQRGRNVKVLYTLPVKFKLLK